MQITRVFKVEVRSELVDDFEEKFAAISVDITQSAPGNLSVDVLRPTKWTPYEYAMLSTWKDEASLQAFAGDNWNRAVIPDGMEKYVASCSVSHYKSWS
ncbi:MAG: antibiotic biosynthesis monooxygenase family protein [Pseudomonadota bacterium]